ncbi:MAG TPA: PDZ domain-containing protein [Vicinamibacterales bacterium]|nr:PDZ domain-containing protein [Vicinamibacterales bacterium]
MLPLAAQRVAAGALAILALQPPMPATLDGTFDDFFRAHTFQERAAAAGRIAASGATFDEAFKRLRAGRTYVADVPRGVVQGSYRGESGEYFYTLDVPATYDPARRYQLRIQLHGGVGRVAENAPQRAAANARLAGAEQIYLMPSAWREAAWWSSRQLENLRALIDLVKRTYNVDENRVVLSGVSDGGSGVYYVAMRETTPFASFLPLNGFIMVLRNETMSADGDLFPQNLVNKPMFVVNGGRDPLYPTRLVDPFVDHLKKGGVDLVYRPQPDAGHDTSWWPELKDGFEQFVADHPRHPLPDTLTWETASVPGRAHWLVIDRLAAERSGDRQMADVNRKSSPPAPDFGIRAAGTRINRVVEGSNAQQIGLKAGDVVAGINNQPTGDGTDVADLLRAFPAGRPLLLTVVRGGRSIRLTGRFAPTILPGEADWLFPREHESGRIDLARTGNRVEAHTAGVAAFTLLLSPDQFDLTRAVTVVVNGRTVFEGMVQKNLDSLLAWAARDNDRTMLFAAALPIEVR